MIGPHPDNDQVNYEVRGFLSDHHGHPIEDPVTGSLNDASHAQWLIGSGKAPTA